MTAFRGGAQAAAREHARVPGRPGDDLALLAPRLLAQARRRRPARALRGAARADPRCHRAPADRRRAARAPSSRAGSTPRPSSRRWRRPRRGRCRRSRSASRTRGSTSCPTRASSPQRFATDHQELIVEPRAMEIIPRIVRHYGEPFADSSAIPSLLPRRAGAPARHGGPQRRRRRRELRAATRATSANLAPRGWSGSRPRCGARSRRPGRVPESGTIDEPAESRAPHGGALALDAPARYVAYMTHFDGLRRGGSTPTSTARWSARAGRRTCIAAPVGGASGAARARRDARGRRQHLPAGRPAGQDGHRDDGPLARGALAAASTTS